MRTLLTILLMIPLSAATSDVERRLAKWLPVKMPFDAQDYTPRQRQMVDQLVEGCRQLDDIFWRQSDPDGLQLLKSTPPGPLHRLLMIQGGRFDLLAHNQPFTGSESMSPGHGLYPKGLTRAEIEQYVKAHPEKKAEIYSPYTVVRRRGQELVGIPYHIEYKVFLERAAQALREAAGSSDDKAFAHFLNLRADALLTDDYYPSDLAWLDLKDPKFDVIFAPYETYLDDVLGVKTSYGAAVLIRNEAESARLAVFQKYVPDIQDALPLAPADRPSKRGLASPMEVMDSPFRAGDLRHGYQAVADNLPNDPRIHQQKGTKKIFFKNFMDARVHYVILPVAKRLMRADQAALVTGEGYLAGTMMHEISHGLGPAFARANGRQVDIREAIGPIYSGLEEAKADITGLYGLKWLIDRGALPAGRLNEYYASHIAGIFRTVRFSTAEAHGMAEMMEYNYFREQKVLGANQVIDFARMPSAIAALAKELLQIEAAGDRARAEAWFHKYGTMPADLKAELAKMEDVPVDIDPIFSFQENVQ